MSQGSRCGGYIAGSVLLATLQQSECFGRAMLEAKVVMLSHP